MTLISILSLYLLLGKGTKRIYKAIKDWLWSLKERKTLVGTAEFNVVAKNGCTERRYRQTRKLNERG